MRAQGTATRFAMRKQYAGPLAGMIFKSIPDLGPPFQQHAAPGPREVRSETARLGKDEVVPFYEAPNETEDQKRRRLDLIATLGGSRAPKGTYGLPSAAQAERSRAERAGWSRRRRLAWAMYWIALAALFAAGIVGLAAGMTWVFVVAVAAGLLMPPAAMAIGVRSELRDRRRREEHGGH